MTKPYYYSSALSRATSGGGKMVQFHATRLYQFANVNRATANWKPPIDWQRRNIKLVDDLYSLANAYGGYKDAPQTSKKLADIRALSDQDRFELAVAWVTFLIALFNKPPAPPKKKGNLSKKN